MCENTQVLADCRWTQVERLGQITYRCFALRKPRENGASRRVRQRSEGGTQMIRFQLVFQLVNYLMGEV